MSKTHLQLATPYPSDREKIWAELRKNMNDMPYTMNTLSHYSGVSVSKCRDYIKCLIAAGYVQSSTKLSFTKSIYKLIKDTGVDAPRVRKDGTHIPPDGRQRMWDAMQVMGDFSPGLLAKAASLPDKPVAVAEAVYYCRWLCKAKYIIDCGNGLYKAMPARRTGPKAPQIQRIKQLFDPNTGEVLLQNEAHSHDDHDEHNRDE